MNRHCVVCGREFGPHLNRCCTDRSLVATATVGFFKKEKKFFALTFGFASIVEVLP